MAFVKNTFLKTDFGNEKVKYSVYGDKDGRNTWNDTTSRFQDAHRCGAFWVERMWNESVKEKLRLALGGCLKGGNFLNFISYGYIVLPLFLLYYQYVKMAIQIFLHLNL